MQVFRLMLVFFFLFSGFASAQDSVRYQKEEVIYGRKDGMALTMLVLKPEKGNERGIVSIISGNWISGMRNTERWIGIAQPYLRKGYTLFFVVHGSQPRYTLQDAAGDIRRAVQFIRYHAKLYGISPDHIGAVGSSSGGHLALMAGLADNEGSPSASDPISRVSGKVQAVACFFPPTDFSNYGMEGMKPTTQTALLQRLGVLGAFQFTRWDSLKKVYVQVTDTAQIHAIARAMSPAQLVTADDPPVLIWHGDRDFIVPLQQSQLLQKKMQALNLTVELKIKQGGAHGWKDILEDENDFIPWFDRHLKTK